MEATIRTKWLEALRSGEYKQGEGFLKDDDKFCCLGVLCDLHAKETGYSWRKVDLEEYFGSSKTLPNEVMNWAGLFSHNPSVEYKGKSQTIAGVNDQNVPFTEIADLIEKQL